MLDFVEKEKLRVEEFLKDSEDHQDKKVDYILYKEDTKETNILASNSYSEEAIEFTPLTKEYENGYSNVPEWDFNFDYYIYNLLEENWDIGYMSPEVHYGIWNSIKELYPEDIDYKDGVQKYLQYCADNGITKEFLDKENNLDTPDIMGYFEGLAFQETINYKGYVIEADDTNYDNPKEVLVNIYKSQQDYIDGERLETISLNEIGLKQNIKEYIDDTYILSKNVESEKAYFTFVLGYDLLNDMLSKSSTPENDVSYDFCNMITGKFLESEEYKNEKHSAYEMLEQWVNDNKNYIKCEHSIFTGQDLENGLKVIDTGYRKNQPIALVRKRLDDRQEYIVVFNYKIDNNKIEWAYGYYYDDNLKKAYDDFNKVLNGGNLSKTFENKERGR